MTFFWFLLIAIVLIVVVIATPFLIMGKLCQHDSYYENMACHGICTKCGRDLGFIGYLNPEKCVAYNDPTRWNEKPK